MTTWFPRINTVTVFLDTTVFEAELFDFNSRHLRTISSLVADNVLQLVLTDVTKREIESHIVETVQAAVRGLSAFRKERQHGVLRHFGETFKAIYLKHEVETLACQLKSQFEAFCQEAKVNVLSTEHIPVGPILERYFSGHPPFSEGRKKSEFPDAIAAVALDELKEKTRRCVYVVSSDKDWQKMSESEDRFAWNATLAEFLSDYPTPEIAEKIKSTLLTNRSIRTELIAFFCERVGFYVPNANGDVESVNDVKVDVEKVLVTGAKDGLATADVTCRVSYHLKITYEVPGTGLWDPDLQRIYAPDRATMEFTETTQMMAQLELMYGDQDPSKIEIDEVTFETDSIEVDISDVLKDE